MKLVIFDFDGVLVNTLELSYNIHAVKNKNLTWKRFQDFSIGNFHEGYEKAVKDGEHIPADDYLGDYEKGLAILTIHDILHDLVLALAKEYKLAIISSTRTSFISDFLQKEKIAECFSDILGYDVHISKVLKIQTILDKYKVSPENAVFITDTLGDIKEANECKVRSVAVTWGLHDKAYLEKGNPVAIIDNPQDLIGAVESVLK